MYRCPLYRKKSDYVTTNNETIGYGLFCSVDILEKSKFAIFCGDKITIEEFNKRKSNGKGGYGLRLDKKYILDCYNEAQSGVCLASMANSPLNLTTSPKANAKLIVNNGQAYLVALSHIDKNHEILYNYGSLYQMNGGSDD